MTQATMERCIVFDCAAEACVGIVHPVATATTDVGVLIVVGGPQYRVGSHRQFVLLARELAGSGYPVFRFDYRGMGDSGGAERDFRFVADDIRAATDAFLGSVDGVSRVVIFGLCDAASAALMYATCDGRIAGLMLANPWVRTEEGLARAHVKHYYRGRLLQKTFWKKLMSGRFEARGALGSLFRAIARMSGMTAAGMGSNAADFVSQMLAGLEGFGGPVLVVLSGRDLTAREFEDRGLRDMRWSRALGRGAVRQERLPHADHTFSSRDAADSIGRICTDWLSRSFRGTR